MQISKGAEYLSRHCLSLCFWTENQTSELSKPHRTPKAHWRTVSRMKLFAAGALLYFLSLPPFGRGGFTAPTPREGFLVPDCYPLVVGLVEDEFCICRRTPLRTLIRCRGRNAGCRTHCVPSESLSSTRTYPQMPHTMRVKETLASSIVQTDPTSPASTSCH